MNGQVGLAVLGCGYWGVNYVRLFSELPGARVVAVCDQRPDRLEEVGKRFPGVCLTTQIDAAIDQDDVDAVVVCTNAATHHHVTQRALMAGKPAEKTAQHAAEWQPFLVKGDLLEAGQ